MTKFARVCFCPKSILWISRHLQKSARATFKKMAIGSLRGDIRKLNPKRKVRRRFSRKQLAAQRLFAKRARAGTLRKGRRRKRRRR